ncbi:MAG TPA: flagellar basal-body MS-ring/collar protein FliF [Solirubrobacterales bacterium]|nr:flagellar basal-body MS-ring/collar protein FliF [Solirubrobacterales bacterium]
MAQIKTVLARLSTRGKLALGGAALALVILAFVLFQMATKQSYTTLATGIEPAETGQVTEALTAKGIPYQLQDGGTAVGVPSANVSEARIALAESDVLGGSKPGFELFDSQQFGASDFQQKVTYQRALEGELERTINQVEGVKSSNVSLTLPEEQLFSEEAVKPTAAVLIATDAGGRLGAGPTRGIAHLVAASVEGLDANNVTITDGSGATLWPAGEGGVVGGGVSKQAIEARYDESMETRLDGLLARTIGPEKGRVQVQAEVEADRTTQSKLEYAKQGTPLARQAEHESLKGAGSPAAGGAAGTAGNIPGYAAGTGTGGGNSNYKRANEETQYGVNKTVTHTQVAPGTVNRQHVALILDKSVPAAEVAQLEKAIEGAAGIEKKRGDTMTVSQIAFAKPPEAAAPAGPGIMDYAKYGLIGLAGVGFLVFAARHLRRKQDEVLAEPIWLKELNAPTSLAELEVHRASEDDWDDDRPTLPSNADEVAAMDSDKVAQQLRSWMKEG